MSDATDEDLLEEIYAVQIDLRKILSDLETFTAPDGPLNSAFNEVLDSFKPLYAYFNIKDKRSISTEDCSEVRKSQPRQNEDLHKPISEKESDISEISISVKSYLENEVKSQPKPSGTNIVEDINLPGPSKKKKK